MSIAGKFKLALAGWRAYRKGGKMANTVLTSTTTQNTVAGVGSVAVTIASILAFVRAMKPGLVPWDESGDTAIVAVIATVIGPLVSRAIAFKRHPEKASPPALPAGVELLEVVRIQTADGNLWAEFTDSFQAAVNAGATLIHCRNENVYRANGDCVGHMPIQPSMR